VLNIRCLSDAQRLMVVDDKGKILYATSPLAALLSTKVLALVNSQMQALLPPPTAQMHKLWMKVGVLQVGRLQRSHTPSHYRQQQTHMRQQRLQQMYSVTSEPMMIAGEGWQCPCGRIHPTRKGTDAVVQLRAISD
jgi:hypothetical protein